MDPRGSMIRGLPTYCTPNVRLESYVVIVVVGL